MDDYIDSRFERLEKALAVLIDSVTKYHPSVVHAEELKAADAELSLGLQQVQAHQTNHLRIQELRQTSAALDAQIRDTLASLAATRRDIVTTHATKFPPGPAYPIAYEELLSYARRISKTTMPPATTIAAAAAAASPSPETQTPAPESQPPSAVTPSAPTPSQTQSPVANGAPQLAPEPPPPPPPPPPPQPQPTTLASMNTSLPESMSQYLNPLSGQLFFPWPVEDKIRSGALASCQILTEQGIDPKGYDPATEELRRQKEDEERKARDEREKAEREERERQMREERDRLHAERERQRDKDQEAWRRASLVAGHADAPPSARPSAGAGEKKQFQFTSLDDLDDDDDDDD